MILEAIKEFNQRLSEVSIVGAFHFICLYYTYPTTASKDEKSKDYGSQNFGSAYSKVTGVHDAACDPHPVAYE